MYCTQCGALVPEDARFCRACGTNTATGDAQVLTAEPPPLPRAPQPAAAPPPNEHARYGGFWRRVVASILDGFVLAGLGLVIGFMAAMLLADRMATEDGSALFVVAYYLGSWIIGWLYFAALHSGPRQASLGKRALGIKVSDLNGERIGFGRASGRYLAYLLLTPLTLGVGLLMAAFTRRKQALHDVLAGTLVVSRETTVEDVARGLQAPKVSGGIVAIAILAGLVPIVGIMAAIAIPAYQDYVIRSQVAAGLSMSSSLKAAVAEAYARGMPFAEIDDQSLVFEPAAGKYVDEISVARGVVAVTYGGDAHTALQGKHVLLVPGATAGGEVVWTCGRAAAPDGLEDMALADYADYTDVEGKYLPSSCRE